MVTPSLEGLGEDIALVLASGSSARRSILSAANVEFITDPADIDEVLLRNMYPDSSPASLALRLAGAKAAQVAARRPDKYVLGADQILSCGGRIFSKPDTVEGAGEHLRFLRGKVHKLDSAIVCQRGKEILWQHSATARLEMRAFSDAFLEDYLRKLGTSLCQTVGAYCLEGHGVQLFEKIEGDYFTILGLPLLPLLLFLRRETLLPS